MKKAFPHNIPTELLAKYFAGEATREESLQVEAWAGASEENRELFEQLRIVWLDTGTLRPEDAWQDHGAFDVDAAWQKVKARKAASLASPEKPARSISRGWKVAASVAVIIGLGWLLKTFVPDPVEIAYVTGADTSRVTLTDSSLVTLNKHSRLSYAEGFGQDIREVTLSGEAFFQVRHDPGRPFVIHANETTIKVLGTSFNVKAYDFSDTVTLFVETGKVLFSAGLKSITVTAGDKAMYIRSTGQLTSVQSPTTGIEQFWRTRRLTFSGQKLPAVIEALEAAYQVNISLENDQLAGCSLSVTFENDPLEDILEVIALTLQLEVKREGPEILLNGQGCSDN